ncbi:MAG: S8 family peptidase [Acidobacteriaceae bacterium]|nr:S8 family peptidase [Acidobacteriaceae bacterium]
MNPSGTPPPDLPPKPSPPERREEIRQNMMRSVVTEPLLSRVVEKMEGRFDVIISLNEKFPRGIVGALMWVEQRAKEWGVPYSTLSHYVFACLSGEQILKLAEEARQLVKEYGPNGTVVYRIWEDTDISVTLTHSVITVKADAAQRAFNALGNGIVWAVLDSGIQGDHPHFSNNVDTPAPVLHRDFTPDGRVTNPPDPAPDQGMPLAHKTALVDRFGHGSHVAGIIGGCWQSQSGAPEEVVGSEMRNEVTNEAIPHRSELKSIAGVAPKVKLVSLKVIADVDRTDSAARQAAGQGKVSWVLMAIDQIQTWNQNGRRMLVHGVNMSLGYDFDPRWFACGQSPICVEVDRLVKSGVSVVVSAGNGGYSSFIASTGRAQAAYTAQSITDPGNADLAVTVGSTHRDMPHTYGVSYFSSRGPTGDGRLKPDLLAPGERIISCAAGREVDKYGGKDASGKDLPPVLYCEQTGTSMAAPHVSGAIAAFLSVRSEFIGRPEQVKKIFIDNSIDLGRERAFQGAGLIDLMKALQAV